MCVELLIERWNLMTSSRVLAVRSGTGQSNPYPEASSKTETDLKSNLIPLQFRNQKRSRQITSDDSNVAVLSLSRK